MRRLLANLVVASAIAAAGATGAAQTGTASGVPNRKDSLKFASIGDMGTGDKPQYEVGAQLNAWHGKFPFDTVIMLGDNLYGSQRPRDFVDKFENPYKPLLDAGVKFYAALGNHDNQTNRFYKPWNMNGERYYAFSKKNVRFFVLDTDYMDPKQLQWLDTELKNARDDRKIVYFHHPLYSSAGRHRSGVPPPARLGGRPARLGSRPARHPRAAVREVRGQRRLRRARSHLRADQAAER